MPTRRQRQTVPRPEHWSERLVGRGEVPTTTAPPEPQEYRIAWDEAVIPPQNLSAAARQQMERILRESPINPAQREIERLNDDIDDYNRRIAQAEDDDDQAEVEYLVEQRDRLERRLNELSPRRTSGAITYQNPAFVDFHINGQKTQACLMGDRDSIQKFNFMVQTNRGSYRRKMMSITWDGHGFIFRRQATSREMAHGFKLSRRPDGHFVVLERKEAEDASNSR